MSGMKGICPKCGTIYAGWALNNPKEQKCGRCSCALELYRDDVRMPSSDLPVIADKDTMASGKTDKEKVEA
jgi:uncharacterized protein (DUF983 family)